ncbi:MBL fold metallo-hydrolase [Chitinimonas lacunae]|uniref:MBL fold metallo-hydrolase n=1 Tax=Chitinimonas lacunae TaxID=1963018 RepID=A0ABV8MME5_9NEIS
MSSITTRFSHAALLGTLSLLAPTAALVSLPAQAAAPQVKTQAPGFYRLMVGEVEITALSDGTVKLPVSQLLTDIHPKEVEATLARHYLPQPVETSINAFLINTGKHLVLVDSGAGNKFGPGAGRILASLKAAGYRPEDIDAVLLTHIHGDHSNGVTIEGKPAFPHAVVYADRHETEFWLDERNASTVAEDQRRMFKDAKEALGPYQAANRLRTFEGETELLPGVRSKPTHGHTPGHSFYVVESQGQRMEFWGDLIHAGAVQFAKPAVTIRFDVDSKAAARQRHGAFAEAAKHGYWVGASHLSFPGIGHLRRDGKGYAWLPVNYSLNEQ